mgnify:FL=1
MSDLYIWLTCRSKVSDEDEEDPIAEKTTPVKKARKGRPPGKGNNKGKKNKAAVKSSTEQKTVPVVPPGIEVDDDEDGDDDDGWDTFYCLPAYSFTLCLSDIKLKWCTVYILAIDHNALANLYD